MFYGQRHENVLIENRRKLADTTVKTAVHTLRTLIIFQFCTTLNFIAKSEKGVLSLVFKHLCVFQKLAETKGVRLSPIFEYIRITFKYHNTRIDFFRYSNIFDYSKYHFSLQKAVLPPPWLSSDWEYFKKPDGLSHFSCNFVAVWVISAYHTFPVSYG